MTNEAKAKRDELACEFYWDEEREMNIPKWYLADFKAGFNAGYECRDNELAIPAGLQQERERSQKLIKALEFIFTSININGLDHAGDSIYLNERDVRDLTDAWNIFKEYEANR